MEVYKKLHKDPIIMTKREIDIFLQEAEDGEIISTEIKNALIKDYPRVPIKYGVPKDHKDLKQPPRRPIVLGIDLVFQPLAIYIDSFLQ